MHSLGLRHQKIAILLVPLFIICLKILEFVDLLKVVVKRSDQLEMIAVSLSLKAQKANCLMFKMTIIKQAEAEE